MDELNNNNNKNYRCNGISSISVGVRSVGGGGGGGGGSDIYCVDNMDDDNCCSSSYFSGFVKLLQDLHYQLQENSIIYESDLHLAAELGKTLLDRNKELENLLKDRQTTIEDQKLEIEYLTKQTVALKEVNDSRLRIYEQLEVSIQDLERTNHRLQFENSTEKKHIRSLNLTIDQLESKCEELHTTIDDLRIQIDVLKRKSTRNDSELSLNKDQNETTGKIGNRCGSIEDNFTTATLLPDVHLEKTKCATTTNNKSTTIESELTCAVTTEQQSIQTDGIQTTRQQQMTDELVDNGMEEMVQLMAQLRESRSHCYKNERIIAELEEQLSTILKQNQILENQVIQLSHRDDDMKSMHDEFNTLDEVRQGQMCSKCLRKIDQTDSEIAADDDDQSLLDELMTTEHRSSFSLEIQNTHNNRSCQSMANATQEIDNPYKVLVEKYEALVEVHRHPIKSIKTERATATDELNVSSNDFLSTAEIRGGAVTASAATSTTLQNKDTDDESGHGSSGIVKQQQQQQQHYKNTRSKTFSTPTDFSEAETSSSGFSDEISHKATQTEGQIGSFLCTIADGEDCKFSIYDDASPLDSRFRDRPEYRDLFKEIFKVLKKAAENKAEGEELPLLDEKIAKMPPLTATATALCHLPEFIDDDSQSMMSSTMSEFSIQNEPTTIIENIIQAQMSENEAAAAAASGNVIDNSVVAATTATTTTTTTTSSANDGKPQYVLKPLVRQPLAEYLSVEVRKRSSSKRKNRQSERSDSPMTHIIGSPKITYSNRPGSNRKRKEQQHLKSNAAGSGGIDENMWNGHTLQFWATTTTTTTTATSNAPSPTPSQCSGSGGGSKNYIGFKPSSASQDLHKLKKLDMSYAEVLRNADNKKKQLYRHRKKHHL